MSELTDNPYVGLRPFTEDDRKRSRFYGRDEQLEALASRLLNSHFTGVVGSSGCGKSSLVQAGLIPDLRAGFLLGTRDRWHVVSTKPGDAPIRELAVQLLKAGEDKRTVERDDDECRQLARSIEEDGADAVRVAFSDRISDERHNVLLLVDQFEEIFRFRNPRAGPAGGGEKREAALFVNLLLDLAQEEVDEHEVPVYVVVTMRSDFIGNCDVFRGLPEALNEGQFLVPRLTPCRRRSAAA